MALKQPRHSLNVRGQNLVSGSDEIPNISDMFPPRSAAVTLRRIIFFMRHVRHNYVAGTRPQRFNSTRRQPVRFRFPIILRHVHLHHVPRLTNFDRNKTSGNRPNLTRTSKQTSLTRTVKRPADFAVDVLERRATDLPRATRGYKGEQNKMDS